MNQPILEADQLYTWSDTYESATRIEAEIIFGGNELGLTVRDYGTGVSQNILQHGGVDKHYGLPGIKERAEQIGARFFHFQPTIEIEVKVPSKVAYRSARRSVNGFFRSLLEKTPTPRADRLSNLAVSKKTVFGAIGTQSTQSRVTKPTSSKLNLS